MRRRGATLALSFLAVSGLVVAAWPQAAAEVSVENPSPTFSPGWPQWGGPGRDFHVDVELADSWQAKPPRVLWERPLGNGHSAFVVDERAAYTLYGGAQQEAPTGCSTARTAAAASSPRCASTTAPCCGAGARPRRT